MHMIHTISIMQQSTYNMTIEKSNLIHKDETSNKSKNPAPDYEERISRLRFRRLGRSREILLNRAYAYINMYILGLILVRLPRRIIEFY
jgi:hypothetical protein